MKSYLQIFDIIIWKIKVMKRKAMRIEMTQLCADFLII